MTNTKHSPGPWVFTETERTISVRDQRRSRVATIQPCDNIGRADARLIAAAPDLLESLQELLFVSANCHGDDERRFRAEAAAKTIIARATAGATP